jgi:hypothetical protein
MELCDLSNEELAALQRFANKYGGLWKLALQKGWEIGLDTEKNADLLYSVRDKVGMDWMDSERNTIVSKPEDYPS